MRLHFASPLLALITFVATVTPAFSQQADVAPDYRGFNIPVTLFNAITIPDVKMDQNSTTGTWQNNVTIHQIGDDANQDSTCDVSAYRTMMETPIQAFETALALACDDGSNMIFNLYSTMCGFENRGEGGQIPSENIFHMQAAQTEFVNFWGVIAQRLSTNEDLACIKALNLKNEPQDHDADSSLLTWSQLAEQAVAAIRQHLPTMPIIVPAPGANFNRIKELKDWVGSSTNGTQETLFIGINAYPFLDYQHYGIDGAVGSLPTNKKLKTKFWRPLAGGHRFMEKRVNKGFRNFINKFVITEYAVSREAPSADVYLDRFLSSVELNNADTLRSASASVPSTKKCKKKGKKKGKSAKKKCLDSRKIPEVNIEGIFNHALYEAEVWDPRYEPAGSLTDLPNFTTRGAVLQSYFQLNLAE